MIEREAGRKKIREQEGEGEGEIVWQRERKSESERDRGRGRNRESEAERGKVRGFWGRRGSKERGIDKENQRARK